MENDIKINLKLNEFVLARRLYFIFHSSSVLNTVKLKGFVVEGGELK